MSNVENNQSWAIERDLNNLSSENPNIRFNTAKFYKALSEADPRIAKRLVELLKDEEMWVQIAAIESLENLNVQEATDPLSPLLGHEHILVRLHAARALEKLTGKNFGFDPKKIESAYEALGSITFIQGVVDSSKR